MIALWAALAAPSTLVGAVDCTAEPKDKWMSRAAVQKLILEAGYTIDRFKVDGSCYEIYGRNADDKKVEVYFDPVSGKVVKQKIEDR
jgi:hypothetical protein